MLEVVFISPEPCLITIPARSSSCKQPASFAILPLRHSVGDFNRFSLFPGLANSANRQNPYRANSILIQARTTNIAHSSTSAMAPIQELLARRLPCRKKEISLVTSPVLGKKTTSVDALSDAQKDVRFARTRTGMLPTHVRVFAYTLHRSRKDALVVLTSPEACRMTAPASLQPHLCLRPQPRLCSPSSSLRLGSALRLCLGLITLDVIHRSAPPVRKRFRP